MSDILAEIADELDHIPTEQETARLRELCEELVTKTRESDELGSRLKKLNKEIWDLKTKDIPDLSSEIGVDTLGIPDMEVDISVRPYYKANISADWEEDRKQEAFRYLESIGVGDIIRTNVNYALGPSSMELARVIHSAVTEYASTHAEDRDIPEPQINMGVPWNTLTSVVKDLTEKGEPLDLEKIGATVGQMAKIKERK